MRMLLILIFFTLTVYSQGIRNEGNIVVSGAAHIVLIGNAHWTNNGSFNEGASTVHFAGNTNQNIQGTSITDFYNLVINSGNDVIAVTDFNITNQVTMTSGDLDLQNSTVKMSATASIQLETNTNRIKVGNPATNTGTIQMTRVISNVTNLNPGNLGLEITTNQNLGSVVIVRGHQIQSGSGTFSGNSSVARYFDIPSIGKLTSNVNIKMYYWEQELNGHTEANLEQYQWVQEGGTSQWWAPLSGAVNTGTNLYTPVSNPYDSYFTTSTWYGFTYHDRFTLGSSDTPLPITLTTFNVNCINEGAKIEWVTTSEINNNYFTLESSFDGVNYSAITIVDGAGNSNAVNNYYFTDKYNNGEIYYKLFQTDYDGTTIEYKAISVNCNSINRNSNIVLFPNPAKESTNIKIDGNYDFNQLKITNILGKQLLLRNISNFEEQINIITDDFAPGVYNVILKSENMEVIKKLIKIK